MSKRLFHNRPQSTVDSPQTVNLTPWTRHRGPWTMDCGHKVGLRPLVFGGFTLIELMVVVVIIGALVAMVMPRLAGRGEQAKIAAASADIRANIATALKLYELDNGGFPTTAQGLDALVSKSSSGVTLNWNGPYLEKDAIDPWGRPYEYESPGKHKADYDLFSLGRDGISGTEDDVTNWNE